MALDIEPWLAEAERLRTRRCGSGPADYDRAYDAPTDLSDLERFAAVVSAKLGV